MRSAAGRAAAIGIALLNSGALGARRRAWLVFSGSGTSCGFSSATAALLTFYATRTLRRGGSKWQSFQRTGERWALRFALSRQGFLMVWQAQVQETLRGRQGQKADLVCYRTLASKKARPQACALSCRRKAVCFRCLCESPGGVGEAGPAAVTPTNSAAAGERVLRRARARARCPRKRTRLGPAKSAEASPRARRSAPASSEFDRDLWRREGSGREIVDEPSQDDNERGGLHPSTQREGPGEARTMARTVQGPQDRNPATSHRRARVGLPGQRTSYGN